MLIDKKAAAFKALHEGKSAFIIPNPYDAGTAVILEKLGFQALATTSAGYAFSCGKKDNHISREDMMAHVQTIVGATHLPVIADLENGFFNSPAEVAQTIAMAGEAGLAGGSIEDSTNDGRDEPQYSIGFAAERIMAAAEAKAALPFDFMLTGRAENFLVGRGDIHDVIARLQAYQEAGADVLYAPGLTKAADIKAVVTSVDRPVNVVMGLSGVQLGAAQLSSMGVKRISIGSALSRAALGAFVRAGREMIENGTFNFAEEAIPYGDISAFFDA